MSFFGMRGTGEWSKSEFLKHAKFLIDKDPRENDPFIFHREPLKKKKEKLWIRILRKLGITIRTTEDMR